MVPRRLPQHPVGLQVLPALSASTLTPEQQKTFLSVRRYGFWVPAGRTYPGQLHGL